MSSRFLDNLMRALRSFAAGEAVVDHYPVIAYLEPTTHCNLRCPACPTGLRSDIRERTLLPYERYRELIDEWGDYLLRVYLYNWGEPFLHKEFAKMCGYATARGIEVVASSNLNVPLDEKKARALVDSGLKELKVGIDGITPETYAMYRRSGHLEQVLANLALLTEARRAAGSKTPYIKGQFHVFEHNEHEVERAREFAIARGVDDVEFAPSYLPDESYGIRASKDPRFQFDRIATESSQREDSPCSWLWFAMVYNPSGSVSPCCGVANERHDFAKLAPGDSVLAAFNSPKYVQARQLAQPTLHALPDNMGMSAHAEGVICEQCPVPWAIDSFHPHKLINWVSKARGRLRDAEAEELRQVALLAQKPAAARRYAWQALKRAPSDAQSWNLLVRTLLGGTAGSGTSSTG